MSTAACSSASTAERPDGGTRARKGGGDGSSSVPFRADAVGKRTFDFVDASRETPANGAAPTHSGRRLETVVYYPASGQGDAAAAEGAPVDRRGAPYPLVLFVHGSFSTRTFSEFLLEGMAHAGYVAASADFPLTAISTPGGSSDLHVADQVGDLSFLADRLGSLTADAGDAFAGAIDASKYVVAGHSTGGSVTLLATVGPDATDARVAGGIAISGDSCFFSESFFHGRTLPVLLLTGSNDHLVPPGTNSQRAYGLLGAPRVLATLIGGTHMGFTELNVLDDDLGASPTIATSDLALALKTYGDGSACLPIPTPGGDPAMIFEEQHRRTVEWSVAFLDHVLQGQSDELHRMEDAMDPLMSVQHEGL